jgi:hypothetical protein
MGFTPRIAMSSRRFRQRRATFIAAVGVGLVVLTSVVSCEFDWPEDGAAPIEGVGVPVPSGTGVVLPSTDAAPPLEDTAPSTTSTAPPPVDTAPSTTYAAPPPVNPATGGGAARSCVGFPAPACTGLPAGTKLTLLAASGADGGAYRVTVPGTVLDGVHVTGDLLIAANDVNVRNSQIDGKVINEGAAGEFFSFTIADTTIGPESGCIGLPGLGEAKYSATRVLVRGHDDGFRISGNNVKISDSFARLCATGPDDHSDGIQAYCPDAPCTGLVFYHNTVDARNIDATFMVNLVDRNLGTVAVINNLLMGGAYTLVMQWRSGATWVAHGNRIVDKAWTFGPVSTEGTCAQIDWSDNSIVTIDSDYRVSSVVKPQPCQE